MKYEEIELKTILNAFKAHKYEDIDWIVCILSEIGKIEEEFLRWLLQEDKYHYLSLVIILSDCLNVDRVKRAEIIRSIKGLTRNEVIERYSKQRVYGLPRLIKKLDGKLWKKADYQLLLKILKNEEAWKIIKEMKRITPESMEMFKVLDPKYWGLAVIVKLDNEEKAHVLNYYLKVLEKYCNADVIESYIFEVAKRSSVRSVKKYVEQVIFKKIYPKPPVEIEGLIPITSEYQLRLAAKKFKNCSYESLSEIIFMKSYLYEFPGDCPVMVELRNDKYLGWMLGQILSKSNEEPPQSIKLEVETIFQEKGIDRRPESYLLYQPTF